MVKKKSCVEKLNNSKGLPDVVVITDKMSKRWELGQSQFLHLLRLTGR